MPSEEVFDAARARLAVGTGYPAATRYDIAATQASYRDDAANGTKAFRGELYRFLRHVFDVVEADETLQPDERAEAIDRVMARYACEPRYNDQLIQKAHDDHRAALQSEGPDSPNQAPTG